MTSNIDNYTIASKTKLRKTLTHCGPDKGNRKLGENPQFL